MKASETGFVIARMVRLDWQAGGVIARRGHSPRRGNLVCGRRLLHPFRVRNDEIPGL